MFLEQKDIYNKEFFSFQKFLLNKENSVCFSFDQNKVDEDTIKKILKCRIIKNKDFFLNSTNTFLKDNSQKKETTFYFYISHEDMTTVYKLDSKYSMDNFYNFLNLLLDIIETQFYENESQDKYLKKELFSDNKFEKTFYSDLEDHFAIRDTKKVIKGIKSVGYFIQTSIISLLDFSLSSYTIDNFQAEKYIARGYNYDFTLDNFKDYVSYIDIFNLEGDFLLNNNFLNFDLIEDIIDEQIFVDIMNNLNEFYFNMITKQQEYSKSYFIYRFDYKKSALSATDFINYLIKVKTQWKKSPEINDDVIEKYINDLKKIKKYINDSKLIESKEFFQKLEDGIPSCSHIIEDLKIFMHHYNANYYYKKSLVYLNSSKISSQNKSFFKKLIMILFQQYTYDEKKELFTFKNCKEIKSIIEQRNQVCIALDEILSALVKIRIILEKRNQDPILHNEALLGLEEIRNIIKQRDKDSILTGKKLLELGKMKSTVDMAISRFLLLNEFIDGIGYLKAIIKTSKDYNPVPCLYLPDLHMELQ